PFSLDRPLVDADAAALAKAFHEMHERIYSIRMDDDVVEFTTWKVRVTGAQEQAISPAQPAEGPGADAVASMTRPVWNEVAGRLEATPDLLGRDRGSACRTSGPAIIEEATTTILVPRGCKVTVDNDGNYMLQVTTAA